MNWARATVWDVMYGYGEASEEQPFVHGGNPGDAVRLAVHAVPLPVEGFSVNSKDGLKDSHDDFLQRPD